MQQPLRILVVEDEALIALELETLLTDLGHEVVDVATTAAEAAAAGRTARPDLAFVDIHLADGPTGVDAARDLLRTGAMAFFMTANLKRIPAGVDGALGIIPKPYTEHVVRQAIRYVQNRRAGHDDLPLPAGLLGMPDPTPVGAPPPSALLGAPYA